LILIFPAGVFSDGEIDLSKKAAGKIERQMATP
jgi:hypothetical protein